MENLKNLLKERSVLRWILPLIGLLVSFFDGGVLMAGATITPENGGAVGIDESTSVTRTHEDSVRLLLDQIDPKVAKIRPHEVVLDTVSRQVSDTKYSESQTVRHYAIDVIELNANVTTAIAGGANTQEELVTTDPGIFACDQTIFCGGVPGYKVDGVTIDPEHDLMLYVLGISSNNHPLVMAVNGQDVGGNIVVPNIPAGTVLTRGGRAGSESQIQTDAYSGVPTDFTQYLQKYMAQVEESTLHKMSDKEVDWEFTDLEQEAIFDMRRTQNVSFWKGEKRVIKVKNSRAKKPEEVYFSEGVWTQAGKEFNFGGLPVDENNIVGLMKTAFTGNASSKQKIFIMGSDMLEAFEQVDYQKLVYAGTRHQAYGLEFSSIVSKFGMTHTIHDQTLDGMGWSDRGFILDADFLRKWTMGWWVKNFDLRESGQSDMDARSLIEICGLVLKNPEAHTRVLLS